MRTPVIIAARNEAATIGHTLNKLDAVHFEPYVVANDCEDQTAEIARLYGAFVQETQEPGKLPAIQSVLKALGEKALDPILYTDADSYPLYPQRWRRHMIDSLHPDEPSVSSGPIVINKLSLTGLAYSGLYSTETLISFSRGETRTRGANMATHFKTDVALGRVLNLPHIWLGDDRAIELEVLAAGGSSHQVINPSAAVATSLRLRPSLTEIIRKGPRTIREEKYKRYADRAPKGSITIGEYLASRTDE